MKRNNIAQTVVNYLGHYYALAKSLSIISPSPSSVRGRHVLYFLSFHGVFVSAIFFPINLPRFSSPASLCAISRASSSVLALTTKPKALSYQGDQGSSFSWRSSTGLNITRKSLNKNENLNLALLSLFPHRALSCSQFRKLCIHI